MSVEETAKAMADRVASEVRRALREGGGKRAGPAEAAVRAADVRRTLLGCVAAMMDAGDPLEHVEAAVVPVGDAGTAAEGRRLEFSVELRARTAYGVLLINDIRERLDGDGRTPAG